MASRRRTSTGSTHPRWGEVPTYRIALTLEPYRARRHAEARAAEERVARAIEQLPSDAPEFEDMQLVEITNVTVSRYRPEEDQL